MLAMMIAAVALQTAPINLECQLQGGTGITPADTPWEWTVTVYESEGRAVTTNPRATQDRRAIISANAVIIGDRDIELRIDRTDLTFTRTLRLGGGELSTVGKCRVARPVRRAF